MADRGPGDAAARSRTRTADPWGQPGPIIAALAGGRASRPCHSARRRGTMWPVSPRIVTRRGPAFGGLVPALGGLVPALGGLAISLLAAGPALAHGDVPPTPPDIGILLTAWSFEPTIALPLALTAVGWLWVVRRIARHHPDSPVPGWRSAAFLAGIAVIAMALESGIERYDTTLFSIHMVQHLLLMLVAPPLLLLGAPVTQLLRVASPRVRRRVILPILESAPLRVASHPVTGWLAFTGVAWLTHFSPLFDLALEDPLVHDLEHVLFVVSALLFWFPVVGADPAPYRLGYPARLLYLLLQMPPSSFLAMAILFTDQPLYPHYATLGAPYGVTALADQQAAAGIMWLASDLVLIAAILLVIATWMRAEERRTAEVERRQDAVRAAIAERADRLAARTACREVAPAGQPGTGEPSSAR
jgi:putative membrane protein